MQDDSGQHILDVSRFVKVVDFSRTEARSHRLLLPVFCPTFPRNHLVRWDFALTMPLDTIYLTRHGVCQNDQ